jgi:hypothetical protein
MKEFKATGLMHPLDSGESNTVDTDDQVFNWSISFGHLCSEFAKKLLSLRRKDATGLSGGGSPSGYTEE